ncbi:MULTISPECIES: hypothetical protein [unclassified Micromonospora]|uniref:hypothetical protein n=1 Tax=unclassified Micromonospora TaxID=2617518 RepID=UPI0033B34D16
MQRQRAEPSAPLIEPASTFGSTPFWRRLNRLAAERGHAEHPTMLVGSAEVTDRYGLRCTRCDETVVSIGVDRAA